MNPHDDKPRPHHYEFAHRVMPSIVRNPDVDLAALASVLVVDVARLLDDLCVQLGYCLAPEDQERLIASPPSSIDAFTDAVIEAEGLDPLLIATNKRRQVRRIVAIAFGEPMRPPGRSGRRH